MPEIKYVDYGLANRYDHTIEINENLKKYPSLHDAILSHELSHTDEKGFSKRDFMLDFGESKINYTQLLKFMIKHPRSFMQILPFYKKENVFFYDINLIIFWTVLLSVIGLSVFLVV